MKKNAVTSTKCKMAVHVKISAPHTKQCFSALPRIISWPRAFLYKYMALCITSTYVCSVRGKCVVSSVVG